MNEYTELCVTAQKDYCHENHLPMFINSDGRCSHCGRNIFDMIWGGYNLETASKSLISGCPFCRHSFCE